MNALIQRLVEKDTRLSVARIKAEQRRRCRRLCKLEIEVPMTTPAKTRASSEISHCGCKRSLSGRRAA